MQSSVISLHWIANGIVRLCGVQPKDEANSTFTIEDAMRRVREHGDQIARVVEEDTGVTTGLRFPEDVPEVLRRRGAGRDLGRVGMTTPLDSGGCAEGRRCQGQRDHDHVVTVVWTGAFHG